MSWNEAIEELTSILPKFNDYLITGFRQEQVKSFPVFIDSIFREAVQLFNGDLKYLGYKSLSPDKRIVFQLCPETGINRGRANIQQSELELMEYMFEYEGFHIPVYLYVPYLYHNALVINDTKYYIQLAIIERMIYRVPSGVIIKVMRSPLPFMRQEQLTFTDNNGKVYYDSVITVRAHYSKDRKKSNKTPVLLYLLSRYKFEHVVTKIFGLDKKDFCFVETIKDNDKEHLYFKCKEDVYIRVKSELITDINIRRFVASLLSICAVIKRFNIEDVEHTTFYKTVLGKNLYGFRTKEALAVGHADSHLASLSTYLDPNTKRELEYMGVYCGDIFDLFAVVYFNIDKWLVGNSPNDLFEKRIGGPDLILKDLTKSIFTRFYDTLKKNKQITIKNIRSMLKLNPMRMSQIWKIPTLTPNSALYNDNMLISCLCRKQRVSSTQENTSKKGGNNAINNPEHRLHESFVAIESTWAISLSNPGVSGEINLFVQIDNIGCFQKKKMPWTQAVAGLNKYLPQA